MAYVQKPGRGNGAKTGHGLPTPFKQMEETDDEFDARGGVEVVGTTAARKALDAKNTSARFTENMAKNDSVVAAKKRMNLNIPGESKERKLGMARRAGNSAANDTREKFGIGHAKVSRFTSNLGYNSYLKGDDPAYDSYARQYLPERELTYDKKSKKFGSQTLGSNTSTFGNSFTREKYQKATAMLKR